jgi:hypothetical protein
LYRYHAIKQGLYALWHGWIKAFSTSISHISYNWGREAIKGIYGVVNWIFIVVETVKKEHRAGQHEEKDFFFQHMLFEVKPDSSS